VNFYTIKINQFYLKLNKLRNI